MGWVRGGSLNAEDGNTGLGLQKRAGKEGAFVFLNALGEKHREC